jgi:hypothetical protein
MFLFLCLCGFKKKILKHVLTSHSGQTGARFSWTSVQRLLISLCVHQYNRSKQSACNTSQTSLAELEGPDGQTFLWIFCRAANVCVLFLL